MIYEPVLRRKCSFFIYEEWDWNFTWRRNTSCFQILVIFEESILRQHDKTLKYCAENHQPFTEGTTPLYTCMRLEVTNCIIGQADTHSCSRWTAWTIVSKKLSKTWKSTTRKMAFFHKHCLANPLGIIWVYKGVDCSWTRPVRLKTV